MDAEDRFTTVEEELAVMPSADKVESPFMTAASPAAMLLKVSVD